jgi:hypothetical protein
MYTELNNSGAFSLFSLIISRTARLEEKLLSA